jgi:hypothetical protein
VIYPQTAHQLGVAVQLRCEERPGLRPCQQMPVLRRDSAHIVASTAAAAHGSHGPASFVPIAARNNLTESIGKRRSHRASARATWTGAVDAHTAVVTVRISRTLALPVSAVVPKPDSCHHRHPLACGFSRTKHGGCHRRGGLPVTSGKRSRGDVTAFGFW